MRTFVKVANKLLELNNAGVVDGQVVAFTVYEDDAGDEVADLLWVLPQPDGDSWPMEVIDRYCDLANEMLAEVVKFAYCTFRSSVEHAEHGTAGWDLLPAEAASA